MNEPNGSTKSKTARFSRPFAIDFVAPLQLEDCIQRIENDTTNTHMRISIRPTSATNQVEFDVETILDSIPIIHGEGTMQRWEGTFTRIRSRVHAIPITTDYLLTNLMMIAWLFLSVPLVMLLCMSFYFEFLQFCIFVFFGIPMMLWVTRYLVSWIRRNRQRQIFIRHLQHLLTAES